ncbi:hypothetical protein ACQP1V_27170 [Microtetraspora malaysiensis]|uniref:hypothetical protein n=1 Tax=Microtetraspora malaysiensis TaxID=161358 RepID=UPI003D8C2276
MRRRSAARSRSWHEAENDLARGADGQKQASPNHVHRPPGQPGPQAWTFHSARPTADSAPQACLDAVLWGDKQPCAEAPLIRLKYGLRLPENDTVQAGKPFTFTVTPEGGRSPSLQGVWISDDKGAHWAAATALSGDKVHVPNPKGPGSISIKVEAKDKDRNSVQQILSDAYLVK